MPVGVRGADDLRRDLGEDEQRERDRDGAERQRELAFAEQPLRDHRRQRRGRRGDERVAEQDHAEQLVGLAEQRHRQLGAARAALRAVLQPVPVDRHHRGLGDREEAGGHQQHDERQRQACLDGMSSTVRSAPEEDLEHELAAEVAEDEQQRAAENPF